MSNISYYHLGNGLTVCDKDRPKENGDYCKIAHISPDRTIQYLENVNTEDRHAIERMAATHNGGVSVTQPDIKIFKTEPVILK